MKRPIERVGARKSLAESVDFAVLWGLLFVVLVQVGYAGDDWPGFRGNPQLTGVAAGAVPEKLELLWTFEAGDGIESTAALARGRAYLTSLDGYLYALDLEEGNVRWKYRAGAEIKSSPALADSTVFFGDEAGVFHAVDAATGAQKWVFRAGAGIVSSANFVGARVFFGSYDQHLYCLSTAAGDSLWKFPTDG